MQSMGKVAPEHALKVCGVNSFLTLVLGEVSGHEWPVSLHSHFVPGGGD